MDWSKDHVLQLIELVRRRPCLYNVEHEGFLNKKERIRAASELAKQISHSRPGTTIEEVLKKWDELCAQFLTKHEHILQSRRGTVSRPFYYDKMSFVLDYISPKPSPKLLLENRDDKDQSTLKCLFEKMTWSQSGELFMPRLRLAVLTSQFSVRRFSPQRIAAPFYSPRLLQPGPYSRHSTMLRYQHLHSSSSGSMGQGAAAATGSPPSLWTRVPGHNSARLARRHAADSARVGGRRRRRCCTTPFRTRSSARRGLSTEVSGDGSPLTDPLLLDGSTQIRRIVEINAVRPAGKNRPPSKIANRVNKEADDHKLVPVKERLPAAPPCEPSPLPAAIHNHNHQHNQHQRRLHQEQQQQQQQQQQGIPLRRSEDSSSVTCFSFHAPPQMNSSGNSLPSQKRGTSDALLSSVFVAPSSRGGDRSCSSAQDILLHMEATGASSGGTLRDEDEDVLYMKYVLCRLKKLDESQKVKLKFEIDKLFYQVLATR